MAVSCAKKDIKKYTKDKVDRVNSFVFPKLEGQEADRVTLKKRCFAKILTRVTVPKLASTRIARRDIKMKKSFWNSFYCNNDLQVKENKIVGSYCKNRWCFVCNRIRTGKSINDYLPEVSKWKSVYFVTLTVPNMNSRKLKKSIENMLDEFSKINRSMKKNMFVPDFKMIRKLEVTYNPERNDFHPHFHIIINNGLAAEELFFSWLKRFPDAKEWCQDVKKVDLSTEKGRNSLIELFKYTTKLYSKDKVTKKVKFIPEAQAKIFQVLRGKRTFQNYGFNLTEQEINEQETEEILKQYFDKDIEKDIINLIDSGETSFKWEMNKESGLGDWVGETTGMILSEFEPEERQLKLMKDLKLGAKKDT